MSDTDDLTIDRDALDPLPHDVEPIASWLRYWSQALQAGPNEYAEDPTQLAPGLRVLAEIASGDVEEAAANERWLHTVLTEDPRTVIARRLAPGVSVADAAKTQADIARKTRQVLRAYLRDVLEQATRLGVSARELAALLQQVAAAPSPPREGRDEPAAGAAAHPSAQPAPPPAFQAPAGAANVVPLDRARRPRATRPGRPPGSES